MTPQAEAGGRTPLPPRRAVDLNEAMRHAIATISCSRVFADGTWVVDYISPGCEQLFGYTAQELTDDLTIWPSRLCPEQWAPLFAESMNRIVAGEPFTHEYQFQHKDGSARWISRAATSRRDDAGDCWIVVASSTDVTDRRRSIDELQQSDARYRRILETAAEGIWMIDELARTSFVNPKMAEMLGYTPAEMLGRSLMDFMDEAARLEAETNLKRRAQGVVEQHEFRFRRKDGSDLWAWIATNPIMDDAGSYAGALGMITDITEIRRIQQAEQQLRVRLEALINSTDGIVWEADPTTLAFTFVSDRAQRLLGYPCADWTTNPRFWVEHIHPDDRDAAVAFCLTKTAAGETHDFEYRMVAADGRFVWIRDIVSVELTDGKTSALRGLMIDITESKLAAVERDRFQTDLLQAQKVESIGRLAGGIAHDFNNMLVVILGYCDMLTDQVEPGSRIHSDLGNIRAAAQRSANLTRQLLTFARKQPIEPRSVDLNATVVASAETLRRLVGEDVAIVVEPGRTRGYVRVDPVQLDQVLTNLVVNARDAIAETRRSDGVIRIRTAPVEVQAGRHAGRPTGHPGSYACIIVSDNGCGMDDETITHLFEPFYTTKGTGRGTGLGCAMIDGIVKQNGGFVTVDSRPGAGATFTVHLPLHAGEADDVPGTPGAAVPRGSETILLVEDEPVILALAKSVLHEHGYTVLATTDPREAMQAIAGHPRPIDLLVTDVIMPGMNGQELATRVLKANPATRVLFISGYSADMISRQTTAHLSSTLLAKPFTPADLARKIRAVLDETRTATLAPAPAPAPTGRA